MKTVARCDDAGLSLAALARLGGAVEQSKREAVRARVGPRRSLSGGTAPQKVPPLLLRCATGSSRWSSLRDPAPQQPWATSSRESVRGALSNYVGKPAARRRPIRATGVPRLLRREMRNDDQREEPKLSTQQQGGTF